MKKINIPAGKALDVVLFPEDDAFVILDKLQEGTIMASTEEIQGLIDALQKTLEIYLSR